MRKRKILLVAHDVTLAHLARPLRLANLLHEAGHDVTLAASADSAPFLRDFPAHLHTLAPTGKARFIRNLAEGKPVFDLETLKGFAAEDDAILARYQPDMVIGDFRITLSATARRTSVPYATITNAYWSPAFDPHFVVPDLPMVPYLGVSLSQRLFDLARPLAFAYHSRPMNALRQHYGLPSLGNDLRRIYTDADLALFSDIPELYGLTDERHPGGRFLGPIQWAPNLPAPDWWDRLSPDSPIIYITLGSSGDPLLLPSLVDALRPTGFQLIVATAGASGVTTGGQVFCADYLPGNAAAARASVVICNGGSPTSFQALAQGTPILGIPSNLDQHLNMHFVTRANAGLVLRRYALTQETILTAIDRLLSESTFRNAAASLAAAIKKRDIQRTLTDITIDFPSRKSRD